METFTKLSSNIVASSIWQESDHVRLVWITMLFMKDKNGEVKASIPGLAHLARVPLAAAEEAVNKFLAPDPYSRTSDHEGRRIEPIDGGWRILNHFKYRDMRNVEERREYKTQKQREYREQRSRGQCGPRVDNCGQCGPQWTDTYTDTDTSTSLNRDVGENASPAGQAAGAASAGGKEARRSSGKGSKPALCDADYLTQLQALPAYQGIDVKQEHSRMTSWCWVNGKQPTRRRLVNWLNRCDRPMEAPASPAQPPPQQPKTVWTLKQQIESVQAQIAEIERNWAMDTPHGLEWVETAPEGEKTRYRALRAQRKALREQISAA